MRSSSPMADEESSAASFEKLAEEASSLQAEEEEAQDEEDAEAELEAYLMAKSELEEATTFKNDEVCISLLFYRILFSILVLISTLFNEFIAVICSNLK